MNMETILTYLSIAIMGVLFFLYKFFLPSKAKNHNNNLPPSPPSLPILGHLHLVKSPYYKDFQSISQSYGPIFSLRLGCQPILVVSSPSLVEECLSKNDVVFANRPNFLPGQHLGYNFSHVLWSSYGDHWRNLRRVATITMLSLRRINEAGSTRKLELKNMIKELLHCSDGGIRVETENETKKVKLSVIFDKLTRNFVMRLVNGKPWEKTMLTPSSLMNICDFLPFLRWVGYKGLEKKLLELKQERDEFIQSLIDDCRERRRIATSCGDNKVVGYKTLIEELLDLQEGEPDYYTDDILKGHILVMLLAASENVAETLKWAMSNLLNNPKNFTKARTEIDIHVGNERLVDDTDLPNLSYINCIVNETLRQLPVAPLLIPHYSSKDCTIGGFYVPKGTTLFVNAWALHMDPNLWDDPNVFKPERFETEKQYGFKFIPFGIGRRACPGNNMALRNISLTLATLIQCFDWEAIECGSVEDSTTKQGSIGDILNVMKEKPLEAICYPRASMKDVLSQILKSL